MVKLKHVLFYSYNRFVLKLYFASSFTDKPGNVHLNTNITRDKVCKGIVVNFTCTADANPVVDTYTLYENGEIVNIDQSGVWIREVNTSGEVVYRCEANNSVGSERSSDVTLTVEGELIYLFFSEN